MSGKRVWLLWTRVMGRNGRWGRWEATEAALSRGGLWSHRWEGDDCQCRVTYAVVPYPSCALKRDGGKDGGR